MCIRDSRVCDVLHHHGLATLRAGDEQATLPLADWRDDVDYAAGDVLFTPDVTLEFHVLGGVQRGQVLEENLVLRRLGCFAVDLVNLDQRKIAFAILGLSLIHI